MTTNSEKVTTGRPAAAQEATTASRVAKAAHNVIDDTSAKAEKVELQLREKASETGRKVEASQEKARAQIDESIASIEGFVKEKPMASAGIAFAAGMLVSALLRR